MKKYLTISTLLLLSIYGSSQLQLRNSQWRGHIKERQNQEMKWVFKIDTVFIYTDGSSLTGAFAFSQTHDTLTVIKIPGGSGRCPDQSRGIYRVETFENGEKFFLRKISEECPGRSGGMTANPFERIHTESDRK
jgi:hypothetical protein